MCIVFNAPKNSQRENQTWVLAAVSDTPPSEVTAFKQWKLLPESQTKIAELSAFPAEPPGNDMASACTSGAGSVATKANRDTRLSLLLVSLLLALAGCGGQSQVAANAVKQQDLQGLPYNPLVYHLDLSIFAYQLYGQTLAWPFDPYYEESNNLSWDRAQFIERVRAWAKTEGAKQVKRGTGLDGYRGPGVLGGFDDNASHDPIVYRYDRLHPWSDTLTNADGVWTEYLTPKEITQQIRDVYVCYRETGQAEGAVAVDQLISAPGAHAPGARDVLLAFEGGTGDKGEAGQPASQSLMGFVLLRYWAGSDDYDVHIAFRGSRSGSAGRAVRQSFSDDGANGNPDWITDLGYNPVGPETGGGHIATTGSVSRGFARSMASISPQLFRCLSEVANLGAGGPPKRIYVTGHSLGGALAQHFVSTVLLGDRYGPAGAGDAMPSVLQSWPWGHIKLITFGAPRAGDARWAETLTTEGLESEFFSTAIDPVDRNAFEVTDPSIVPRLIDKNRPAGFRVLISKDPVTTEKVIGGKHVGKTVYVNEPGLLDLFAPPDFAAHEPWKIRKFMLASLADPRIPATAWRYRDMMEVNPERNEEQRGSSAEFVKLSAAVDRYYHDNNLSFDQAAFARDVDLFQTILQAD